MGYNSHIHGNIVELKTTIDITDGLFQTVKQRTSERGVTFREAVESGLHRWLEDTESKSGFTLEDGSVDGNGQVREMSFQEMIDVSYEDRGA